MNWNSHVHALCPEGVFTDSGHFVAIPDIMKQRAVDFWQERIFAMLIDEHKISEEIAGSTRSASACAACARLETLRVQC